MNREAGKLSSSFVVRVTEIGPDRLIRVQDVSTGEIAEFRSWREFLKYAEARRRGGSLR